MTYTETAFAFRNDKHNELIGIITAPDHTAAKVGLLIIVGGPQYRIGSHRQYVHLARYCAAKGIASMRFDYQGTGDSDGDGEFQGFEHVKMDIFSAIDQFLKRSPDIQSVAIWGLCEGASSILLGGTKHHAVSHIILVNPWVRSPQGLAKAYVKHYYWERLKDLDFYWKILSGNVNLKAAAAGFLANLKEAFGPKSKETPLQESKEPLGQENMPETLPPQQDNGPFADRMLSELTEYKGKTMLILSEHDLVAREFDDLVAANPQWHKTIQKKVSLRQDIAGSDHTFSTKEWSDTVAENTANWLLYEEC